MLGLNLIPGERGVSAGTDRGAEAPRGCPRRAVLLGCLVWFIAFVDLVRFLRADLLISSEASWAIPRLVLTLFVVSASTAAGVLAAGGFFLWSRTRVSRDPLKPFPLSPKSLLPIMLIALCFGVWARFAWLDRIPPTIWFDEILAIDPSLSLEGRWRDFRDAIRILPAGPVPHPSVGVLYLEGYRLALLALGTDLFAVRFPSALVGVVSLITAFFLARRLLPRGGGTIAVLVLAGLRWPIILARYGWNGLVLVPIVDVATLLLLRARRRSSLGAAAAAGLVAGLGTHAYLGTWIAALALGGFLLWPAVEFVTVRRRAALSLLFGLGFLAAAAPIFLFHKDRPTSYFGRASHQSLLLDVRRTGYWTIPFTIVADSFQAPWLVPDPERRHDLPKSRLGWIVGIPVALALLRAVRSPRDDLSALLFCHAGAAIAASLRWGFPGHPNGFRFAYLTTVSPGFPWSSTPSSATAWTRRGSGPEGSSSDRRLPPPVRISASGSRTRKPRPGTASGVSNC